MESLNNGVQFELKRTFGPVNESRIVRNSGCDGDKKLRKALEILLSSRGCWTNGEPEIPEEISAQFDITLPQAQSVHDAVQ